MGGGADSRGVALHVFVAVRVLPHDAKQRAPCVLADAGDGGVFDPFLCTHPSIAAGWLGGWPANLRAVCVGRLWLLGRH